MRMYAINVHIERCRSRLGARNNARGIVRELSLDPPNRAWLSALELLKIFVLES